MDRYQEAWESFLLTGSVDDYMSYCARRKSAMRQEELYAQAGGARLRDAADDEGRRPPGQKNGG